LCLSGCSACCSVVNQENNTVFCLTVMIGKKVPVLTVKELV
jgi:hypothetical protein